MGESIFIEVERSVSSILSPEFSEPADRIERIGQPRGTGCVAVCGIRPEPRSGLLEHSAPIGGESDAGEAVLVDGASGHHLDGVLVLVHVVVG